MPNDLKERIESAINVETVCGNLTDSPRNRVRIMKDALARITELEAALEYAAARFRAIREYGDPFEILNDPEEFGGTDDGAETVCMVYENIQSVAKEAEQKAIAALPTPPEQEV